MSVVDRQKVHFLHIGKTGGSAVKSILEKYADLEKWELVIHNHKTPIDSIPNGEKVIFFLREPKSRLISGFYSRQRNGRPRYDVAWTEVERQVFEVFKTPNELAAAFADSTSEDFLVAKLALENIQHLKKYEYWYISREYFQSRIDDILFVGFQESLEQDFNKLKKILGIPEFECLPTDDIGAHRNLKGLNRHLDEVAVGILNDWYVDDIEFVSYCKALSF